MRPRWNLDALCIKREHRAAQRSEVPKSSDYEFNSVLYRRIVLEFSIRPEYPGDRELRHDSKS